MLFFNGPLPSPDPPWQAVRMAAAMRKQGGELAADWRKRGHQLAFRAGIALGYATLGRVGFEGRYDYGAIGPVTQRAAGLSEEAGPGQILVSQRVYGAVEDRVEAEPVAALSAIGLHAAPPAWPISACARWRCCDWWPRG